MHAEFCMISDRPEVLTVDDQNRPHNATGPFCLWRDGSRLWSWHGVHVPGWIINHPERITPEAIDAEENSQVRSVMIERYGLDRYALSGIELDRDGDYRLLAKPVEGQDYRAMKFLVMRCPTTAAVYVHPVHPDCDTVNNALAWKRQSTTGTPYRDAVIWEK
jgi:hypothetical protein